MCKSIHLGEARECPEYVTALLLHSVGLGEGGSEKNVNGARVVVEYLEEERLCFIRHAILGQLTRLLRSIGVTCSSGCSRLLKRGVLPV